MLSPVSRTHGVVRRVAGRLTKRILYCRSTRLYMKESIIVLLLLLTLGLRYRLYTVQTVRRFLPRTARTSNIVRQRTAGLPNVPNGYRNQPIGNGSLDPLLCSLLRVGLTYIHAQPRASKYSTRPEAVLNCSCSLKFKLAAVKSC
jgi:hypothetical protein